VTRLLAPALPLLVICLAGCGGAHKVAPAAPPRALHTQPSPSFQLKHLSQAAREVRRAALVRAAAINASAHLQPPLRNDGDNDQPGDSDSDNRRDTGRDPYIDYLPPANNKVYHDEDDQPYLNLGKAASTRDRRVSAALVKRYYAAAFADDGARACAMMPPWLTKTALSKAVALSRGEYIPRYPRSATTCAAVLSLLFRHLHRQLPRAIRVTDVRVSGFAGRVFFGAKTMRASQIILHREGGHWRIVQLIGKRLV
jgi:hypothetical protein